MVVLQNPSSEPKTHQWRPGAVAPSREVPSQICAVLCPKTAFFGPKRLPNLVKTAKRRKALATFQVRLDLTVSKSPLVPSTPRYVRETAQKGAKKPQKRRNMHQPPETKHGPYLGLRGSKSDSEGT